MAIPLFIQLWNMDIDKRSRGKRWRTAEIKFRRNVAGYTLKDQIWITVIVNKWKIFNLNNIIRNNSLNWIHCVERLVAEHIPKQLRDYTPRWTRSSGCPELYRMDHKGLNLDDDIIFLLNIRNINSGRVAEGKSRTVIIACVLSITPNLYFWRYFSSELKNVNSRWHRCMKSSQRSICDIKMSL